MSGIQHVTIPSGTAQSGIVNFSDVEDGILHMPIDWTAANVAYLVSDSVNGPFNPLYDISGSLVESVVDFNQACVLPSALAGIQYFRLWSQNAAADEDQLGERPLIISTLGTKIHRARLDYLSKILSIQRQDLIGYWPLNEVSGTNADNAEGTAARDGTYTGVALNTITGIEGLPVGLWDGVNDYCDVYSTSFRDVFDGAEGTISIWAKVLSSAVWTDATERYLVRFRADGSNTVNIFKTSSNNELRLARPGGGVNSGFTITGVTTTDWFNLAITWSELDDEVRVYFNGAPATTPITGLGTWVGNLATLTTLIGSVNQTPTSPWSGYISHGAVWKNALVAADILAQATI